MCHTHLELDPETDAKVSAALDAAVAAARAQQQDDDVNFDHLKADALVDLITGARADRPASPRSLGVDRLLDVVPRPAQAVGE